MKKTYLHNIEISRLCRGLSLFLHAGITLSDGLSLLAGEHSGEICNALLRMSAQLDDGFALSAAMHNEGIFSADVIGMVKAGEKTGRLEEALSSLALYYDSRDRTDKLIRNSFTYPSMLMLVILAVIAVMLIKVLPVFDSVYASLGSGLTGLSGALLALGAFLGSILPLLIVVMAAAVIFLAVFFTSESFRSRLFAKLQKRLSSKGIFHRLASARFAESLAMGLRSGLSDDEAVALAGELLSGIPMAEKSCQSCITLLSNGKSLPDALCESGCLPKYAASMLGVGIKGGCGDKVMEELAARLSDEAAELLEGQIAMIEPLMVTFSSVLIGILLLSVMLPLVNIMSAIG